MVGIAGLAASSSHCSAATLALGVGGGAGFSDPVSSGAAPGAGTTGAAGQNITINFNQPLTTQQNIGKAVQGALRSIGGTGHATARGI